MATVAIYLTPENASVRSNQGFAQYVRFNGSDFAPSGLAFDGAGSTNEHAYWKFSPFRYISGNVVVGIRWYAESGTSGTVDWAAGVAAITPDTDTQDVETKTFPSVIGETDTHLGTTARRLHQCDITLSNVDNMAAGDEVWLRILRAPSTDTLTADAILTSVVISYTV